MCAILAAAVTPGVAQGPVTADIPFSFTLNMQKMSAGRYTFEQVEAAGHKALIARSESTSALVISNFYKAVNSDPKLVFLRIGNQVVLTGIAGLEREYEFPLTPAQAREAIKVGAISEISLAGK